MGNRVANHIHRYKKVDIGRNGNSFVVYKCQKPVCTHYIRVDLAEGKLCECNKCGDTMLITKETLTHSGGKPMSKPHCNGCVKRRKPDDVAAIADFLSERIQGTKT